MSLTALHQFFILYSWFGLTLFILFMALVARFYERFSGINTHYRLYIIPVILFGISAVRDASTPILDNDWLVEFASLAGAGLFFVLIIHLARYMLSRKQS